MYILLLLLLIPFLLIVFFGLFALLFAWSSVMKLWYSLTGKKPKHEDFFRQAGQSRGFSQSNNAYQSRQTDSSSYANQSNQSGSTRESSQSGAPGQKIFSKDDGEYVDFEIVE